MPQPIPVQPRDDGGCADIKSLVQLGRAEPPPVPQAVFVEPVYPDLPGGYAPDEPA